MIEFTWTTKLMIMIFYDRYHAFSNLQYVTWTYKHAITYSAEHTYDLKP